MLYFLYYQEDNDKECYCVAAKLVSIFALNTHVYTKYIQMHRSTQYIQFIFFKNIFELSSQGYKVEDRSYILSPSFS